MAALLRGPCVVLRERGPDPCGPTRPGEAASRRRAGSASPLQQPPAGPGAGRPCALVGRRRVLPPRCDGGLRGARVVGCRL